LPKIARFSSSESAGACSRCAAENTDAIVEIFTVTSAGAVSQLTDDDSGATCESLAPSIADDGSGVAFTSFCDLRGANTDENFEIYRTSPSGLEQLTTSDSCSNGAPDALLHGTIAVWSSDCDLVGDNADGSDELFIDRPCACGAPVTRYQNGPNPLASDALTTLRSAVGVGTCSLCDCDVNTDGKITASDALSILKRAVGQNVALVCA